MALLKSQRLSPRISLVEHPVDRRLHPGRGVRVGPQIRRRRVEQPLGGSPGQLGLQDTHVVSASRCSGVRAARDMPTQRRGACDY